MVNVNELTTFLGWCTVINTGFYLFAAFFIIVFKNFTINLHSKMVGIAASELPNMYYCDT